MKKFFLLLILCLGMFGAGCTLTESTAQRNRRILHQWDLQCRMMVDDTDMIFMTDNSSTTTYWSPYVGSH